MEGFVHPLTGELLEASQDALVAAMADADVELGRIYRALDPIRERLAELRGPAVLPRRKFRTDKQTRVGICPRCGDHQVAA